MVSLARGVGLWVATGFAVTLITAIPATAAPRLFFSDLVSGPTNGGEGDRGVFVTLWGEGFGSQRGDSRVTVGGGEVARYLVWGENNGGARGLDRIVVQLGSQARSGGIVVSVGGESSQPLPFVVRPGRIFFVANEGSDAATGSFAQPWCTVAHAALALLPGDVVYLRDGVAQTAEDAFDAALSLTSSGTPAAPKAIVAYPGARATVGSGALYFGTRVPNLGQAVNDWVFAGLVLRGRAEALEIGGSGSSRWRVIGNDISCTESVPVAACFTAARVQNVRFLGNRVHDIGSGTALASKQAHAVYFTTDTNHVEVGWNEIVDNQVCRAVQFHSSPLCIPACGASDTTGRNQYDLAVHDNLIRGSVCDGINFATVDPARGAVRASNNVLVGVGAGPPPPDGDANYAGIYVAGATNTGADGSGVVEVRHNTFYDCGRAQGSVSSDRGALARGDGSPALRLELIDNLVVALAGEEYLAPTGAAELIGGHHNLWFGSGPPPGMLSANLEADPQFVAAANGDFRLEVSSPAIDSGAAGAAAADYLGVPRPQGAAPDLGAFEFVADESDGSCRADERTLCLSRGRFRVTVGWRDHHGTTGSGHAVALAADSGLFWFFGATNLEMLVKVLDGCALNGRYWMLAAAATDVEYTLLIRDMVTGQSWSHVNPLGRLSPAIADTASLDGCP
jgi:hypothetical protein